MLYVHLSACIGFALPPQGSHPVSQPVAETGARHLQVGLEGAQLTCSCFFFRLPSWNFQDPNITELCSLCSQDCGVIGWAELCERKKLTAGCFQLQCLGLQGI